MIYQNTLQVKDEFALYEKEKAKQMFNFQTYVTNGFRVFYCPAENSVFFHNSTILKDIEGDVSTFASFRMLYEFKGKNLFLHSRFILDYSGILLLFATLFMCYIGVGSISGLESMQFYLKHNSFFNFFYKTILCRLLIMLFVFLGLGIITIIMIYLLSPNWLDLQLKPFLYYFIYLLLFLVFFYLIGSLVRIVFESNIFSILIVFLVWFLVVFLIPEISRHYLLNKSQTLPSIEKINLQKITNQMSFERTAKKIINEKIEKNFNSFDIGRELSLQYRNNEFVENNIIEANYRDDLHRLIKKNEYLSQFFPSLHYTYLANEVSGKGFNGYIYFLNYILNLRDRFFDFYVQHFFIERNSAMKSFVTKDENIFYAKSHIPRTYWVGFLITVVYCLILLGLSYFILKRKIFTHD
jgi:hypothetical protein